jgi:hypothetical protein
MKTKGLRHAESNSSPVPRLFDILGIFKPEAKQKGGLD